MPGSEQEIPPVRRDLVFQQAEKFDNIQFCSSFFAAPFFRSGLSFE
jgi:hypothetical protein